MNDDPIMRELELHEKFAGIKEYENGCKGKVRYQTEEHAHDGARMMKRRNHCQYDIYTCRCCGELHVGRRSKAWRKRAK